MFPYSGQVEPKSVTIVAPSGDLHANAVKREVELLGYPCTIADPRETLQSLAYGLDSEDELSVPAAGPVADTATSVWWRRPVKAIAADHISNREFRRFIGAEWDAAFYGYLRSVALQIVNDPAAEHKASLKVVQLATARRVGLTIPRTLVTNDPVRASEFIETGRRKGRRTVVKPLTPPANQLGETRVVEGLEGRQDALRQAPVILQECIERGTDLRITVVDGEMFAATVDSERDALVDWRADENVSYTRTNLDPRLEDRLAGLMDALGLRTGSIDVRVSADGTPFFFEVNPSGQFLFLELELDYPIAGALARALLTLR
ncbi:hypothetical protein [Catellatospora citrea]|uniref:ATP-grasp domain-containing protein n=1 Tax=Catellatospora citrea TaxID=53366 RepID=A0A8J3KK33_9ACTN|nr:hypothetical protein [Catellatospora citrea]RKE11132.1 hypothetical protein C8E86_6055 [Catellatospora citrea]GIF96594.1 hypothetical protein Cci01nite_16880 [Catellatospora citrea]